MPKKVVELLACWKGRFGWNDFNMVWNVIPSCLMWNILREMDARSFKDCEKTSLELQLCFLKSLFGWIFVNTLLKYLYLRRFLHSFLILNLAKFSFLVYILCT